MLVAGAPVAHHNNAGNWCFANVSVSAVPEPGQAALWLAGLGVLAGVLRSRRYCPTSPLRMA